MYAPARTYFIVEACVSSRNQQLYTNISTVHIVRIQCIIKVQYNGAPGSAQKLYKDDNRAAWLGVEQSRPTDEAHQAQQAFHHLGLVCQHSGLSQARFLTLWPHLVLASQHFGLSGTSPTSSRASPRPCLLALASPGLHPNHSGISW